MWIVSKDETAELLLELDFSALVLRFKVTRENWWLKVRVKPATDLAAIAVYKNKGNFRENRNGVILSLLIAIMKCL